MIEPMVTEGDAVDETVTLIEELIAALGLVRLQTRTARHGSPTRDPVPRAPDHGASP